MLGLEEIRRSHLHESLLLDTNRARAYCACSRCRWRLFGPTKYVPPQCSPTGTPFESKTESARTRITAVTRRKSHCDEYHADKSSKCAIFTLDYGRRYRIILIEKNTVRQTQLASNKVNLSTSALRPALTCPTRFTCQGRKQTAYRLWWPIITTEVHICRVLCTYGVILLRLFNVILFIANFAYLSLTRNDLIVDKCRHIALFCYMKISCLKCIMGENARLQNIYTK